MPNVLKESGNTRDAFAINYWLIQEDLKMTTNKSCIFCNNYTCHTCKNKTWKLKSGWICYIEHINSSRVVCELSARLNVFHF